MLLDVLAQLVGDDRADRRPDLGRDELVLRLVRVLRIADLDRDDGRDAFAQVLAGDAALGVLEELVLLGVLVDRARERLTEAGEVRATVAILDRVREAGD